MIYSHENALRLPTTKDFPSQLLAISRLIGEEILNHNNEHLKYKISTPAHT